MTWISEHHRMWRTALLLLLVVAFVGPWTGDRISVPGEYACSPPYIRTEDDMCDMIGVFGLVFGFFRAAGWLLTDPPANLSRELFFLGTYLLFLLPILTTLLFILLAKRRPRLHIVAWGLAVIAIISWSLIGAFPPSWMWGLRLYIGVAIVALALELSAFVADRRPGLAQTSER